MAFASDFEKGKYYIVTIEPVTKNAPLKPIKEALSKVFGDSVTVYADENGKKIATIQNNHLWAFFGNGEPCETDIKLKLDLLKATQKAEETTKSVSTTQSSGIKTVDDSNNIHENKNYIVYTVLSVVGISVVVV